MNREIRTSHLVAFPGGRSPTRNRLLAALPDEDYEDLLSMLEWVRSPDQTVIHDASRAARHAYFPVSGIVSVISTTACGGEAEVAMVGDEGLVGIATLLGGDSGASRAVVQIAGHGYRLPMRVLQQAFHAGGALQHLLLHYSQAVVTQAAQAAICIRYHSIEQRICCWLLSSLDRLPVDEITVTQRRIASALGVRRETISLAARRLKIAGMIDYDRGLLSVLDRKGLETRTCECYSTVNTWVARLMSVPYRNRRTLPGSWPSMHLRQGPVDWTQSHSRGESS